MKLNITISVLWLFLLQACQSNPSTEVKDHLFVLLDPVRTGIDFVNKIEQEPKAIIFIYEYFFNGAGVAAGDLNEDGKLNINIAYSGVLSGARLHGQFFQYP